MTKELQRILYVEDEADIQTIAKISLETIGEFTLEICSSGQEALDKASSFAPDLILLDVMMPGMDGPTTLEALRQNPETANTPVIFMTAKAQPHEIRRYMELGAIDFISKPFDPVALPSLIREKWARYDG